MNGQENFQSGQNLIKYINATSNLFFIFLVPAVIGLLYILALMNEGLSAGQILVGLALIIVGVVFFGIGIHGKLDAMKKSQELAASAEFPWMAAEFETAQRFCSDTLRLSENYIFSKGTFPHRYYEIERVFQYVHQTNGIEDRRELKARYAGPNNKSTEVMLCQLKTRGRSDADAMQIVSIICSKNPSVAVGYKA